VATGSCAGLDGGIQIDAPIGGAGGAIDAAGAGGTTGAGGVVGDGGLVGSGGKSGAGGITGAGGKSGAGGLTGTGGTSSTTPGPCGDLVDDMELGTGWICTGNDRVGFWFTYVDDYDSRSTITPLPNQVAKPVLMSTPRDSSQYAMHAYGTFTDYAGLGVLFNIAAEGATPKIYDASAYTGIKFWAKGSSSSYLRVFGQMDTTESVANGGTCALTTCTASSYLFTSLTSSWKEVTLPFSYLAGGSYTFKASRLWSIEFGPYSCSTYDCSFDFWIDDIRLYK
jgi:hypothetical protein